jgi:hypothetical protein
LQLGCCPGVDFISLLLSLASLLISFTLLLLLLKFCYPNLSDVFKMEVQELGHEIMFTL